MIINVLLWPTLKLKTPFSNSDLQVASPQLIEFGKFLLGLHPSFYSLESFSETESS